MDAERPEIPEALSRGSRPRSALLRWGIPLLVSGAFTFALLEGASYAYLRLARGYDGEHLMNYQFDPYKNIRLTPGYRDTRGVAHNAQGFRRSQDTPRLKPPGTYRVFLMGGSTAYGLRSLSRAGQERYPVIRNEETIDAYLERFLAPRVPTAHVEVINAAITSFFSHHHLIYLNQKILKFDPDLIIFLDGFNDYYPHVKGYDQFAAYAYNERATRFMGEPSVSAWLGYSGWWLFRKSHFVHVAGRAARNLRYLLRGEGRPEIDVEDAVANLRENAPENFVAMVERNGLILAHEGVDAVFVLQPEISFAQSKTFSAFEREVLREMNEGWPINFVAFKNRARPLVREFLNEASGKSGALFLDATDVFGGIEGDVYTDYCHLTPLGNRVLAEYVGARALPVIQARLEERRSPPTPSQEP